MSSILIGGGQDYYGPTAERDRQVVRLVAIELSGYSDNIQFVTGGTGGIPDDFAQHCTGRVVDIVSSEYLSAYKERTANRPRPYWVAGETQEKRRLAFVHNPDISVALFIQGGKYTTHEMQLFHQSENRELVAFHGSGGASGGLIDYNGWTYPFPERSYRAYDSTDPDADPTIIAVDLARDVIAALKRQANTRR